MPKPVLVVGKARIIHDINPILLRDNYEIKYNLNTNEIPLDIINEDLPYVVAIGGPNSYLIKAAAVEKLHNDFGYPAINIVSIHALVPDEYREKNGIIVFPMTYVSPSATLGNYVLLYNHVSVGHDTSIGDYSTLVTGARMCGHVRIGKNCFVGANVCVKENINVCNNVLLGCGAVVVKDITEPGVYVGNPARRLR